jgi:hypothetical protein
MRTREEGSNLQEGLSTASHESPAPSVDFVSPPEEPSLESLPPTPLASRIPKSPVLPDLINATPQPPEPAVASLSGFRVVDLQYFQEQLFQMESHDLIRNCGLKHVKVIAEKRFGLRSCLKYKCDMCNKIMKVWTHRRDGMNVNQAAVTSAVCSGLTYEMQHELFGTMNIPTMSSRSYYKILHEISLILLEICEEDVLAAGEEEKRIAISKGQFVIVNGKEVPWIAVKADGTWLRRSYKGNYNSLLGAVSYSFYSFLI